jgi:acyl carrier protein
METTEIKSRIKEIVAGMFDVQSAEIPDTKTFTEMAKYDSMRALEFLAKVENEFNVTIDPDQLPNMNTVEKTANLIDGLLHVK